MKTFEVSFKDYRSGERKYAVVVAEDDLDAGLEVLRQFPGAQEVWSEEIDYEACWLVSARKD